MGNVTSDLLLCKFASVQIQNMHFQVAPCLKARVSEAIDKNHFLKKGFELSLTLKVRVFGTREWPVRLNSKFAILTAI